MPTEYQLPQLPHGSAEATLVRWLKRPGERLILGDPLLVVANDCVEVAFPATVEGVVEELLVDEGAPVIVGATIARISAVPTIIEGQDTKSEASPIEIPGAIEQAQASLRRVTPVARRLAAASEIDISAIKGSGPGGRIIKADVLAYLSDSRALTVDKDDKQPSRPADTSRLDTEPDTSI